MTSTLSFTSLPAFSGALDSAYQLMIRADGSTFYTATINDLGAASRAYMDAEISQMKLDITQTSTSVTQLRTQLNLNQFNWIESVPSSALSQITSAAVIAASGTMQVISGVGTKLVPWTTAPSGGFNIKDISITSAGVLLVIGSDGTSRNYPTVSMSVAPDTSNSRVGIATLGYDASSTSVVATGTDGTEHVLPISTPGTDQVAITNVAMGSDGTLSLTDSKGVVYTIPKLVYGGLDELPRGGHTFQIGDRRIYAFGVDNVYGSDFDITFPEAYTEVPVVYVVATQEYNTKAAVAANPVAGSVTAAGCKVAIQSFPVGSAASAYSTSANGCFVWILSIGTQ